MIDHVTELTESPESTDTTETRVATQSARSTGSAATSVLAPPTVQEPLKRGRSRLLDWLRLQPQEIEPVAIMPYRPSGKARFQVEADLLRVSLVDFNPHIEHIGSTAVPGMAARPIVDMVIGVDSGVDGSDRTAILARMRNFGYLTGTAQSDVPIALQYLVRQVRDLPTHQVHVVEAYGDAWHRLLLLRDLLRVDPLLAAEYEGVKRRLARLHSKDPYAYMAAKTDFIERVLDARGR
jgi:GrpB-like predicted nucleotidyltransferase (UPF0157 family)